MAPSFWQRNAPILTLLFLAPVIAEVLPGATRLSAIFVLPAEIGVWGCAALLIRWLVRRRRLGWGAMLLLAIALAVAEECIIQQTSLAPLVTTDPIHAYGRWLGVNWVYLLWALGYESVWVVILPVYLTERSFPLRRADPWIGTRGAIIASAFLVLSAFVAWFSWTQHARQIVFHMEKYTPPLAYLMLAVGVIALLIGAALGPCRNWPSTSGKSWPIPSPWLLSIVACILAALWYALVLLAFGAWTAFPANAAVATAIALSGGTLLLMRRWSAHPWWNDAHRHAVLSGAVVGSMLAGFGAFAGASPLDLYGKLALNLIALVLLIRLGRSC